MIRKKYLIIFVLGIVILGGLFLGFFNKTYAQGVIEATVKITVCGNNVVETGEQCDGVDLAEQTCIGLGYDGGNLACHPACIFNTTGCTTVQDPPPAGGGGGLIPPIETMVILKGRAHPLSQVTVLMDGRVIGITEADSTANFRKEITDITSGIRTFGIWSEDGAGRRSRTHSFTTNIKDGMITTISGIFLPPTIELERTRLQRGEILNILGQTAPESEISIFIHSREEIIRQTKAGDDGIWFYALDTIVLEDGAHSARVRAACREDLLSNHSQTLAFSVGDEVPVTLCPQADLNKDGFTNLIDFSIMLYWWRRHCPYADQNQDRIVNLTDFSIMLYHWTG